MIFFVLVILLIYITKDFIYSNIKQLNAFTQIIESFLKVIDSKDHYTQGHCERVAKYTKILSKNYGVRKIKREKIVNISKIHDIGKIKVPDKILKSKERLSDDEYEEIKRHCIYGYDILEDINLMNEDLDIILYHHERYDGDGYPEGLSGKEIPLGSRILSVCDAFDVMTTGRSYKLPLSKSQVIYELKTGKNTQFDPDISTTMIELIKNGSFDHCFEEKHNKKEEYIISRCSRARGKG
jgi:HD-GYP domain-containing protein (c-di-GMP phosphodiesterase class II)